MPPYPKGNLHHAKYKQYTSAGIVRARVRGKSKSARYWMRHQILLDFNASLFDVH